MATVDHPQLKTRFQGVIHRHSTFEDPVYQFRGIQYANLPGRYRLAELNSSFPPETNAILHGPACPQLPFPLVPEDICIGASTDAMRAIALDFTTGTNELKGLNLVVTSPRLSADEEPLLPVIVWIHGGGCEWGSNSAWVADGGSLVVRSVAIGQPIVFVTINYRISLLGWATSEKLGAGDPQSKTSGIGNYGLHDAHLALEWVAKFIEPFGGDPKRITLAGHSCGASVVRNLVNSSLPARFSRAILQSATPLAYHPRPLSEKSAFMEDIAESVGVDSAEKLRDTKRTPEQLLGAYWGCGMGFNASPSIDHTSLKEDWETTFTFAASAEPEILIGETGDEGTLWLLIGAQGWRESDPADAKQFLSTLRKGIGERNTTKLTKLYDISLSTSMSDLYLKVRGILREFAFVEPNSTFAKRFMGQAKIYRYAFDKCNPFPGPMGGTAGHAIDLAYLFGVPKFFERVPNPDQEVTLLHTMQDRWITFANGIQPWKSVNDGGYASIDRNGVFKECALEDLAQQRHLDATVLFEALTWPETWELHQACLTTLRRFLYHLKAQQGTR